jgi:hypothetical protein
VREVGLGTWAVNLAPTSTLVVWEKKVSSQIIEWPIYDCAPVGSILDTHQSFAVPGYCLNKARWRCGDLTDFAAKTKHQESLTNDIRHSKHD